MLLILARISISMLLENNLMLDQTGIAIERTYGNENVEGNTMEVPLSKADVFVYNYVTRSQAKAIAEKMYTGKSYLITGAGWDRTLDGL